MRTIRFINDSGINVFVNFNYDDIEDIVHDDIFLHYVLDLHCTWSEVGRCGLSYIERRKIISSFFSL